MKNPLHYRHKVHAAFDCTRRGQIVAGAYRKNTHDVVDIESCMIEEQESDEIIRDIKRYAPLIQDKKPMMRIPAMGFSDMCL